MNDMQTFERRIAAIKQRDSPPVARRDGESVGALVARMVAAIPVEVLEGAQEIFSGAVNHG